MIIALIGSFGLFGVGLYFIGSAIEMAKEREGGRYVLCWIVSLIMLVMSALFTHIYIMSLIKEAI